MQPVRQVEYGRPGGENVKIRMTTWLAGALLYAGIAGNALAITVYTDRAAFESALNAYSVEDFESYPTYGTPDPLLNIPDGLTSLDLNDFSLTATPQAIKILNAPHSGAHNTTPGGSQFLYLDTDTGTVGSSTVFSLDNPVDAFGFDYTAVYEPGTVFTVSIGSEVFNLALNNPEATPLFWGVIGLGDFSDITLHTSTDSGYGVDEVTFGSAVPLPPAFWLFGSGLMVLAGGAVNNQRTRGLLRPRYNVQMRTRIRT
jgi:hypothetical protein